MAISIVGPGSTVIKMNLVLFGSAPNNTVYTNQLALATADEFAYANTIAGSLNALTNTQFVTTVLTNLGLSAAQITGLTQPVVDYINAIAGTANRGIVALQLANILTTLEGNPGYGAAALAFNNSVTAGYNTATGATPSPGQTFDFQNLNVETLVGTSGDDTFRGNATSFNNGDSIQAGAGNDVLLLSLVGGVYDNVNTTGLERVQVDVSGNNPVTLQITGFNGLKSVGVSNKSAGNVTIDDAQSQTITYDITDTSGDVTVQLDQQAAQGATEIKVSLDEVTGGLSVLGENGEAVETVSLTVLASDPNPGSTLKFVTSTKGETLNIAGGVAGQQFKITGALDSTLKTVNAGTFIGNLDLNATANGASQALAVTLGAGNDKLDMGDGYGDGDVINGGAGADQVTVKFTSIGDTTRAATMTKVETLNATFNAPVSFEGGLVDDLKTINLAASTSRADFNFMDQTLDTLNITGNPAQGVEVDYDGAGFAKLDINITGGTTTIGNAGNKAAIRVTNADTVNLTHAGTANVSLNDGLQVDDTFTGRSTNTVNIANNSDFNLTINPFGGTAIRDGNVIQSLSVTSTKLGDITAGGSDASQSLLAEADGLQSFTVSTALDSDFVLGLVGNQNVAASDGGTAPADDLESVIFNVGVSSDLSQYGIDADDSTGAGNGAATVSTIGVTGAASSLIHLNGATNSDLSTAFNARALGALSVNQATGQNWLQAASIGAATLTSSGFVVDGSVRFTSNADGILTDIDAVRLIGLDFEAQGTGSQITLSGSAEFPGLYFHDEVVSVVDASGLTNTAAVAGSTASVSELLTFQGNVGGPTLQNNVLGAINSTLASNSFSFYVIADDEVNHFAAKGYTFLGSKGGDFVTGTGGTDTLSGNDGNDFLVGHAGNDTLNGGDGDDALFGDDLGLAGGSSAGNDIIDGGAGNDIIVGGANVAPSAGRLGDVLTGGDGSDGFVFHLQDSQGNTIANEIGKSTSATLKEDFITDFTPGVDTIFIDVQVPDNTYTIAYYNDVTANATFINQAAGDVQVVVRRGDYNLTTGTFAQSATGADYQVLFMTNGADFATGVAGRLLAPGAFAGGGSDFNAASHEIAVLGLAGKGGSLDTSDIQFI